MGSARQLTPGAILRGDLRRSTPNNAHHVVLSLGKYCLVGEGAVLRPPGKIYKGTFTFYPVRIGDCVHIGPDAIVEAASVGHGVEIGARAIVVSHATIALRRDREGDSGWLSPRGSRKLTYRASLPF